MSGVDDRPIAFRAKATRQRSRWLRRTRREISYDALCSDGQVRADIDLVELMYQRAPADYVVVREAMHRSCPDTGLGPWISYPDGNTYRS